MVHIESCCQFLAFEIMLLSAMMGMLLLLLVGGLICLNVCAMLYLFLC